MEKNKLPEINYNTIFGHLMSKKNLVLDGYEEATKLALYLKKLEHAIEFIKEEIKEDVLADLIQPVQIDGYEIKETAGGKYDYSKNPEVVFLENKLKGIKEDMKKASKLDVLMDEKGRKVIPGIFKPNKRSYKIEKLS